MSRCNFDGWSDVIGEVPWCLCMQTTVRHEAELESDPLWHVQPVQFVVSSVDKQAPANRNGAVLFLLNSFLRFKLLKKSIVQIAVHFFTCCAVYDANQI